MGPSEPVSLDDFIRFIERRTRVVLLMNPKSWYDEGKDQGAGKCFRDKVDGRPPGTSINNTHLVFLVKAQRPNNRQ